MPILGQMFVEHQQGSGPVQTRAVEAGGVPETGVPEDGKRVQGL